MSFGKLLSIKIPTFRLIWGCDKNFELSCLLNIEILKLIVMSFWEKHIKSDWVDLKKNVSYSNLLTFFLLSYNCIDRHIRYSQNKIMSTCWFVARVLEYTDFRKSSLFIPFNCMGFLKICLFKVVCASQLYKIQILVTATKEKPNDDLCGRHTVDLRRLVCSFR